MQPSPLLYNDETFALPSFRLICFVDMPVVEPQMKAVSVKLLDLFLAAVGDDLAYFAKAGSGTRRGTPKAVSHKVISAARRWLAEAPFEWPTTFRFNGWLDEPHAIVSPPHLRIEQRARLSLIQIELPPEMPDLVACSDHFCDAISDLPVVWGALGMGIYLPTAYDSLIWMLPRVTPRYRVALEAQPDQIEDGLRRRQSAQSDAIKRPGIPDIGWRTLLGADFVGDLNLGGLHIHPEVKVTEASGFSSISAGPAPIWGDVNLGEDVTAYNAIAATLKPRKLEWAYIQNAMFGSGGGAEKTERLEKWFTRFEG